MNKEKLIELGVANQSVAMQVQRKMHNIPDVRVTEIRVDNPEDFITIDSMDDNGQRREQSIVTIQQNGEQIFSNTLPELVRALKTA